MSSKIQKTKKELALNMRRKILDFEQALEPLVDNTNIVHQDEHAQVLFPLKHSFADGVYVRQMSMKKDTFVIGKIHKHLHVWFLVTGNILVITEDSEEEYVSPCYVIAKPGTKRVIYCNEDCVFVNIHKNPDELRDIKQLEKQYCSDTWEEYEEYINKKNK